MFVSKNLQCGLLEANGIHTNVLFMSDYVAFRLHLKFDNLDLKFDLFYIHVYTLAVVDLLICWCLFKICSA